MPMHLYDGDSWSIHPDLETAKAGAKASIDAARDVARFDREWPGWVEDICISEGPADAEEPGELPVRLQAVETNVERPSSALDEDGYDDNYNWWESPNAYTCDYDLAEPVRSQ